MDALAQTCSEVGTENRVGAPVLMMMAFARVDFLFLSRVPPYRLLSNYKNNPSSCDTRRPTPLASQSHSFPLSPPLLQLYPLLHVTSRLAPLLTDTKAATRGTRRYTPLFLVSPSSLTPFLINLRHRRPRGRPYHTKPRPSRIMYYCRFQKCWHKRRDATF